uniref:Uncharacterized protein n=1 Tax=Calidris pygmaea TaxID=425635 RepID=A0A8C3K5R5_9CHAR
MAEVEAAGNGAGGSPEASTGIGTGTGTGTGTGGWRRPHGPLQRYYGPSAAEAAEATPDPADINGPHFDPEVFLTKATPSALRGPREELCGDLRDLLP